MWPFSRKYGISSGQILVVNSTPIYPFKALSSKKIENTLRTIKLGSQYPTDKSFNLIRLVTFNPRSLDIPLPTGNFPVYEKYYNSINEMFWELGN